MSRRAASLIVVPALFCVAAEAPGDRYTAVERRHWAFQPRKQVEPPKFALPADRAWVRSPIDAFILTRLKGEGLKPAPPASKSVWLRRVYLDLTGLPPSPEEAGVFIADASAAAYEKVVDRLLASPRYGERWAQHWLDVVRFAETDGFEYDTHRPDAWRYRDYVIRSIQADKPYNQFLTEQLAGDEAGTGNEELLVAAGFQRLGPLRKNAGNQEVASSRNEVLTEMTNVVGAAMLGVTLGCARCHDHKFDPIRHKDYYRMQAFFAPAFDNDIDKASPEEKTAWKKQKDAVDQELRALRKQMRGLDGEAKTKMEARLKEVEDRMPEPLPAVYSVKNDFEKATPIHVLARGDYDNKGARVGMRPLGVLLPDDAPELPAETKTPRTELAKWITDPANPLTARVMVNRIWGYHFGRGIVISPNDFGRMGSRPSHPELLDWLASEFVNSGWRMKPLHKMIVLSSAYRQSSSPPMEKIAAEKDPEDGLVWKYNRRRMDAEQMRDSMLAVAGRINLEEGGPSVIVPAEREMINLLYKPSQWAVTKDVAEHDRRSIYLLHKRNLRLPMMEVFDAPDMQTSCARRETSTHAPQALELLNGAVANDLAQSLAARLDRETKTDEQKVDRAYRLAAGRGPTVKEKQLALEFLKSHPLREFSLAVFNLNSFLYIE